METAELCQRFRTHARRRTPPVALVGDFVSLDKQIEIGERYQGPRVARNDPEKSWIESSSRCNGNHDKQEGYQK
jgi:hypothetical protein